MDDRLEEEREEGERGELYIGEGARVGACSRIFTGCRPRREGFVKQVCLINVHNEDQDRLKCFTRSSCSVSLLL